MARSQRAVVAAVLLSAMLGGCSDLYWDRRDTITLHSGEAMAANVVTETIDPWSKASGNNKIAYSGDKAATAAERYRTGRVIRPLGATTSSASYAEPQQLQPLLSQPAPAANATK
jgi:hypothetical protein